MYFKLKIILTLLLVISSSFKLFAKEPQQRKSQIVISETQYRHLIQVTWIANFNIEALKQNKLLGFFESYHLYLGNDAKIKFKNIPNEVNKMMVYGNTVVNQGDINVRLYGDFKDVSVENLVFNQLLINEQGIQLERKKSYRLNKIEVLVYKILGDKSKKKIYATKVNDEFIIVSNQRITSEMKKISKMMLYVENEDVLVSLNINTDAIRKKSQQDSYLLQSKVFNNTKTIVFKVVKGESNIYLACALDTNSKETAIKINKVITGIVENSINNNQKLANINTKLINNLKISIDDTRVILNTSMPLIHKNQ